MRVPTLQQLEARVILLEEQVVSLTEMLMETTEDPEDKMANLEAQHVAFVARLKEKRR